MLRFKSDLIRIIAFKKIMRKPYKIEVRTYYSLYFMLSYFYFLLAISQWEYLSVSKQTVCFVKCKRYNTKEVCQWRGWKTKHVSLLLRVSLIHQGVTYFLISLFCDKLFLPYCVQFHLPRYLL